MTALKTRMTGEQVLLQEIAPSTWGHLTAKESKRFVALLMADLAIPLVALAVQVLLVTALVIVVALDNPRALLSSMTRASRAKTPR